MKVVVIGASGHIGTYLVPRLVAAGHEVVAVSRGRSVPYRAAGEWEFVERIALDRAEAEAEGTFGSRIARERPDVVIDLICFDLESCRQLREALDGAVGHFLHCGTIWVHGTSAALPATESAPRNPFGEYGMAKAAIESYLLAEARMSGFPATVLHPGHIVGPGWAPINPQGNLNTDVFDRLAQGRPLALPDRGLSILHHVHADDVAQAFVGALDRRQASLGESYHVVSPQAVTLVGYARAVASWFGREATLELLPWGAWSAEVSEEDRQITRDHIARSLCLSIDKARRDLGYVPRYSTFEAVREAVDWLVSEGRIAASPPSV